MTIDSPGFHARGGWYFRREPDGSVHITAPDSLGPGAHQVVVLDPDTWASVVAYVSAAGDDARTWCAARDFHTGAASPMLTTVGPPAGATLSAPTCPTCCTHDHSVPNIN